jgi:hypothetical protein
MTNVAADFAYAFLGLCTIIGAIVLTYLAYVGMKVTWEKIVLADSTLTQVNLWPTKAMEVLNERR